MDSKTKGKNKDNNHSDSDEENKILNCMKGTILIQGTVASEAYG